MEYTNLESSSTARLATPLSQWETGRLATPLSQWESSLCHSRQVSQTQVQKPATPRRRHTTTPLSALNTTYYLTMTLIDPRACSQYLLSYSNTLSNLWDSMVSLGREKGRLNVYGSPQPGRDGLAGRTSLQVGAWLLASCVQWVT